MACCAPSILRLRRDLDREMDRDAAAACSLAATAWDRAAANSARPMGRAKVWAKVWEMAVMRRAARLRRAAQIRSAARRLCPRRYQRRPLRPAASAAPVVLAAGADSMFPAG